MKQTYDIIVNVSYGVHIICQVIDDLKWKDSPYIFGFDLLPENKKYLKMRKIFYIVDQCAYLQGKETINYICEYFIYNKPLSKRNVFLPISIYSVIILKVQKKIIRMEIAI